MSHHTKRHGAAPVPPGNQPKAGPAGAGDPSRQTGSAGGGSPFEDHDAKQRIGDFETAGEHSRQQPSAANDGQQHSR